MSDSKPKTGLITRRRLFLGALAGAALACAGAVRLPGAAPGHAVLSHHELRMVAALGDVLFPEGNAIGPSARELDLPLLVDTALDQTLTSTSALGFRWILRVLWTGAWFSGRSFLDMDPEERLDLLHAWDGGSLLEKGGHDAIKSVLGLAYFNHPSVLEAVGFSSPCHAGRG